MFHRPNQKPPARQSSLKKGQGITASNGQSRRSLPSSQKPPNPKQQQNKKQVGKNAYDQFQEIQQQQGHPGQEQEMETFDANQLEQYYANMEINEKQQQQSKEDEDADIERQLAELEREKDMLEKEIQGQQKENETFDEAINLRLQEQQQQQQYGNQQKKQLLTQQQYQYQEQPKQQPPTYQQQQPPNKPLYKNGNNTSLNNPFYSGDQDNNSVNNNNVPSYSKYNSAQSQRQHQSNVLNTDNNYNNAQLPPIQQQQPQRRNSYNKLQQTSAQILGGSSNMNQAQQQYDNQFQNFQDKQNKQKYARIESNGLIGNHESKQGIESFSGRKQVNNGNYSNSNNNSGQKPQADVFSGGYNYFKDQNNLEINQQKHGALKKPDSNYDRMEAYQRQQQQNINQQQNKVTSLW